jgi:hypothetical protein
MHRAGWTSVSKYSTRDHELLNVLDENVGDVMAILYDNGDSHRYADLRTGATCDNGDYASFADLRTGAT